MHRYAYLLLLLMPAATWAQDQKPAPAATATICFYRPHRFEGAALKPPVIVDEVDVAHLHNGDAVQVTVSPGSHKLHSNDKSTGIELDARAGQTYFVRVDIKTGGWKGHGQVTLIDAQEGKYEFSQQKLSASRDLTSNPAGGGESAKAPGMATTASSDSTTPPRWLGMNRIGNKWRPWLWRCWATATSVSATCDAVVKATANARAHSERAGARRAVHQYELARVRRSFTGPHKQRSFRQRQPEAVCLALVRLT
jgi:hypothetical protein